MSIKAAILLYTIIIFCGIGLIILGVRENHYLGIFPILIGLAGIVSEVYLL